MNDITKIVGAVVILAVLAVGTYLGFRPTTQPTTQTKTPSYGALAGPEIPSPFLVWGGGGTYRVTGQCYGGTAAASVATSTLFSVQNPWSATSTLVFANISGTTNATSTDIIVATSTTPNPAGTAVATSSIVGNIFAIFNVAANTPFFSVAGVTMGGGKGYTAPSSGTYSTSQRSVVVGPLEYVVGFATSTGIGSSGGTGTGQLTVLSPCNYRLDFERE